MADSQSVIRLACPVTWCRWRGVRTGFDAFLRLGIIPQNSGGFGDIGKAREVFYHNEIRPLQIRFMEVNEWLGDEVIQFNDYQPTGQ